MNEWGTMDTESAYDVVIESRTFKRRLICLTRNCGLHILPLEPVLVGFWLLKGNFEFELIVLKMPWCMKKMQNKTVMRNELNTTAFSFTRCTQIISLVKLAINSHAPNIVQVMLLWVAAFWFIGSWMIPFMAHISGFHKDSLTFRGQALFSLITDVTEGIAGIAILHRCLSMFRPLASDWFRFTLKGNWQLDVIIGCFMFPFVNRLSQLNLNLLPLPPTSSPVSLSSVEQSIMARDPVAMALYVVVVSVCAPVWEEIVFRGFLLPSLTRYMPVWCAILVSSVAFALAHFNVQRMLPLVFLGVVLGLIFARSRNLLPSMLLHSLWNGFVFMELMR